MDMVHDETYYQNNLANLTKTKFSHIPKGCNGKIYVNACNTLKYFDNIKVFGLKKKNTTTIQRHHQ